MEMEDSALRHIMGVQTQMLQHITRLQEEQSRNSLNGTPAPIQEATGPISSTSETVQPQSLQLSESGNLQTPLASSIASPVMVNSGEIQQPLPSVVPTPVSTTPLPSSNNPMAVSNPTQYGTVATLPYVGGRPNGAANQVPNANFAGNGLIGGTIRELRDFDASRASKEATSEFFSSQTRGVQEQAVNVLGGAASGIVGAGSFLIPGILPSLVLGGAAAVGVGGVTKAISEGASDSLDYQEILQNQDYKFINAFESTDEMGGIGMGLEQRQEASSFLRDLADEKYIDDPDMQTILEGAAQNSLLKTVNDVKSFKEKFSQVVDAVKEISVTMNASLEEATAFMGEMERRGISTRDMPFVAAQTKIMSSMAGISTQEGLETLLSTSDAVVQGTGINAGGIIQSTAENTYYAQELQDQMKEEDPEMYNYLKNQGGSKATGPQYEQLTRNFIRSDQGSDMLVGLFGAGFELNEEGDFDVNEQAMGELMNSDSSNEELMQKSREFLNTLDASQIAKLSSKAGEIFSNSATGYEASQFLQRQIDIVQQAAPGMDAETALVEGLGVTDNYMEAEMITDMIAMQNDPERREMLLARTLREESDSSAIANRPGLFKSIKFGFQRAITNPLGDVGQSVSDTIGSGMEDYQKWVTGVDTRSMVGGTKLEDFDQQGLENVIGGLQSTADTQESMANSLRERASETGLNVFERTRLEIKADDIESGQVNTERLSKLVNQDASEFNSGALNTAVDRINKGTMSAAEVGQLSERMDDMGVVERQRAQIAIDAATGEFDTIGGKMNYLTRRADVAILGAGDWVADNTFGKVKGLITGEEAPPNIAGTDLSQRSLEKSREELMDTRSDLSDEVMNLFANGDLNLEKSELKELEKAIESGDKDAVASITENEEARRLASEYSNLEGQEKEFSEGMGDYNELKRYTKGVATSGYQLGNMLKKAGVYSDDEVQDILGGVLDRGEKTTKRLKKGKMTTAEMVEQTAQTQAEVDEFFGNMLDTDATKFAEYFASRDPEAYKKIFEEGTFKDGSGEVNIEGLQEYVMDQARNQHITDPDKDGKKKGKSSSEDAKEVAKDHEEAMGYYLSSMQNETAMLRDAAEGRPVSQNASSLSQR